MKGLVRWLGEAIWGDEPYESYVYWGAKPPEMRKQFTQGELEERVRGYAREPIEKQSYETRAISDEQKSLDALRALEDATGTKTSVYLVQQIYRDEAQVRRPYDRFDIDEIDITGLQKNANAKPREDAMFARYVVYAFTPEGEQWANRFFGEHPQANEWNKSYTEGAARYERTWVVREERPRSAAAYAKSAT